MAIMAVVFNGCKNKDNIENLLVGNWVIIGEQEEYNMRFEGVELYLEFKDNGKMVLYLYNGEKTDAVWENGVLSGECWISYETYTWNSNGSTISFSPEFWYMNNPVDYRKVNNNIVEIGGTTFGRVKQLVTTK